MKVEGSTHRPPLTLLLPCLGLAAPVSPPVHSECVGSSVWQVAALNAVLSSANKPHGGFKGPMGNGAEAEGQDETPSATCSPTVEQKPDYWWEFLGVQVSPHQA